MRTSTKAAVVAAALISPFTTPDDAAAASRSVAIRVQVTDQQDVALVSRGHFRAKAHDQLVVYLSKSCVKTVKSAKTRYVVSSDSDLGKGRDYFVSTLAASEVKPKRGKVCLMIANRKGRAVMQARAPYKLP